MIINVPMSPALPNYEAVINEELQKIGDFSWIKDQKLRGHLQNEWISYKNPAYNDAMVEAFEGRVQARINTLYNRYLRELEKYESKLRIAVSTIESATTQLDAQLKKEKSEYEMVKSFYDSFQSLVKSRFLFVSDKIKKKIGIATEEEAKKERQREGGESDGG